jgi:hypothetical protein
MEGMRTVEAGARDSELLDCLNEWIELMAAGDFTAAADYLCPPEGSNAEHWTAETLRTYIENYGSWEPLADGSRVQVTSVADAAREAPARHEVYAVDGQAPHIEYDLPLDGEWSDLTAIVHIVENDGRWAFLLYDLRVL